MRDEARPAVSEPTPTPAQGGVVRNRKIEPKQAQHAAGEALGLAQAQMEDEPQDEHQLDGQVRIERLSARCGPPWSLPFSDGRLVKPEGQVASALQPTIVLSPVPDVVPGPEALGPVWVWSEGHEGATGLVGADHHLTPRPPLPTSVH